MPENEIQHVEVTAIEQTALEVQERAAIDIQVATAKKYPRNLDKFVTDATAMIQKNKTIAAACVYNRPVGKDQRTGKMKFAEGPSIRLAEIVSSCYGNLRVATIITQVSPRQVKAQGLAFDLEKNYAVKKDCIETTVTKSGAPYTERMRVVVAKSCQSKALRDAIFGVVPRALCTDLIETAKQTMLGGRTLDELVPGVMDWIKELDIKPKRVWDVLGIKGKAELNMNHIITLGGLKTAINDSEITVNEVFPLPAKEQKKGSVTEQIKDKLADKDEKKSKKAKPKEKVTPQAAAEPGSAQPSKAAADEKSSSEQAGSGKVDPALPEASAEEPVVGYECVCGEKFIELDDGKCPFCFSKKVKEV